MRVGIVVQARVESTRLPRKVLTPIGGVALLERLIRRMTRVTSSSVLVVATGTDVANQPITALCRRLGVACHQGPDEDCLARITLAARAFELDGVVRVTADNPLTDPAGVEQGILQWQSNELDYLDNISAEGDPHGTGYEIVGRRALEFSHETWPARENREHVTWAIRRQLYLFRNERVRAIPMRHRPAYRLSVDYPADLVVVTRVYEAFGWRDDMRLEEINAYLDRYPDVARLNAGHGGALPTAADVEAWQLPGDASATQAWARRASLSPP